MKERPILFSAPMVRALLDGTKTQTRRVVKPQPPAHMQTARNLGDGNWQFVNDVHMLADAASTWRCPYGQPGDRLWVREKWRGVVNIAPPGSYEYAVAHHIPDQEHCRRVEYAATQQADTDPWRPSIHMPRWASRITLEITGVRVDRLQDISEADAAAEGVSAKHTADANYTAREAYAVLWESINGPGSWDENPWVWVVEFKRVTA